MGTGTDVREETSVAKATADEPIRVTIGCEDAAAPITEAPPIAEIPPIEPPAEPMLVQPVAETATAGLKMPQALQLAEPAPAISPPPLPRAPEIRPAGVRKAIANGVEGRKAIPAPAKEKAKSRFPLLAATLALAAGLGGAAGAIAIPAVINQSTGPSATAAPINDTIAEVQALRGVIARLGSELSGLKSAVEQSSKLTVAQFGKVAERLDRAERSQAEPIAKIAKIGEALERLERRAAPPPAPTAQNDVTGTVTPPHPPAPAPEAKPKPTIIDEYVVRRVFDGVALIEGRRGIIEVEPGTSLPGAGRVEEIRRQDGRWVVVTSKGLIVPPR
jgi:hypothetical protein